MENTHSHTSLHHFCDHLCLFSSHLEYTFLEGLLSETSIHSKNTVTMNGDKSEVNELSVASEHPLFHNIPVKIIENIFDYLELKDLSAMCGTSKHMQKIACRVYQTSYRGIVPQMKRSGNNHWIVRFYRKNNVRFPYDVDFTYFIPCIDRMEASSLNNRIFISSQN